MASKYFDKKEFNKAILAFTKLLAYPDRNKAYANRSLCNMILKDYRRAFSDMS